MSTPPPDIAALGAKPTNEFFRIAVDQGLSLTYPDVRLASGYSQVLPREADTRSWFSRRVPVLVPISSAAMDTVTTARLAIELGLLGGIGVIHKNMPIEEQARQVVRVKHAVHGRISTPITVRPEQLVRQVLAENAEKDRRFRTFPVTDDSGILVGLVTGQDFELAEERDDLRIGDIMSTELTTAPEGTDRDAAMRTMRQAKKKVLPVVNAQQSLLGLYLFSDLKRILEGGSTANLDENGQLFAAAAIGVGETALARAEKLAEAGVNVLVIDTAHGDTKAAVDKVATLKARYPSIDIVVGNVSEPDSAWRLADAGADAVKVGQGPGSICTTREKAGIGRPQLSAVWGCAKAVRDHFADVRIIADGGISHPGDITIALAAGADSVMVGRMLAGTDEAPGKERIINGGRYKEYRGMGSKAAMADNPESRERYGHAGAPADKLVAEGVESIVPWVGSLASQINELNGGLRAGMGYTGARTIPELRQSARFHRITGNGLAESKPHHVTIVSQ
jgi:IMP dehydrogenase